MRESQAEIARLILAPERLESAAGNSTLTRLFSHATPLAPRLGVGAYAGGYPARLCEALADTFEAVACYAGEAEFAALAARFTAAHRPACYNLNDVGRGLPRFLRRDPLAAALPFLPDLAELEWKMSRAFHATERPPADTAGLAALCEDEWTRVVFELQPGVGTVVSRWPIRTLWESQPAGRASPGGTGGDGETAIVYRRGLVVRLESAGRSEVRTLAAVRRGATLSAALEAALGHGVPAVEAAAWPGRWQRLGILSGWRLADAP